MIFAIVSDVHIEKNGDSKHLLLDSFFNHSLVQEKATDIILLGDIFDFMCGNYDEYYQKYPLFFEQLKTLMRKGKRVHYFEGNHDFHLIDFFNNFFSKEMEENLFFHHSGAHLITIANKKFYFAHGDFVYIGDPAYKLYLYLIKSKPIYYLLYFLLSYNQVAKIGSSETEKSKEKRKDKDVDWNGLKKIYQKALIRLDKKIDADIYILGHSHIQDEFVWSSGNQTKKKIYLNNGYFENTKTFVLVDDKKHQFIKI